jgi:hypothetical protein
LAFILQPVIIMDIKIELQDLLASYLEECESEHINDIVSWIVGREMWYDNEEETTQDLVRRLSEKELSEVINHFLLEDAYEDEMEIERQNSN